MQVMIKRNQESWLFSKLNVWWVIGIVELCANVSLVSLYRYNNFYHSLFVPRSDWSHFSINIILLSRVNFNHQWLCLNAPFLSPTYFADLCYNYINARTQLTISVHMYHIIFIIALYHVHTNHMYQFLFNAKN